MILDLCNTMLQPHQAVSESASEAHAIGEDDLTQEIVFECFTDEVIA
jgi:hypothetical protein